MIKYLTYMTYVDISTGEIIEKQNIKFYRKLKKEPPKVEITYDNNGNRIITSRYTRNCQYRGKQTNLFET